VARFWLSIDTVKGDGKLQAGFPIHLGRLRPIADLQQQFEGQLSQREVTFYNLLVGSTFGPSEGLNTLL
jgi:hypothetical protein